MTKANEETYATLLEGVENPAVPGEIKIVGAYELLDPADISTFEIWSVPAKKVAYTSGGPYEVKAGDTITGAVSGATAYVEYVSQDGGSWAGGDAFGYFYLSNQIGSFQAENLNVGANYDVATISGDSVNSGLSLSVEEGGETGTSIRVTSSGTNKINMKCVKATGSWDISSQTHIKLRTRCNQGAFTIRVGFGETKPWEKNILAGMSAYNWKINYADISSIPTTDRDAVTILNIKSINTSDDGGYIQINLVEAVSQPTAIKAYDGERVISIYPKIYIGSYTGTGNDNFQVNIPRRGTPARIEIHHMTSRGVTWQKTMQSGHSKLWPDASYNEADITNGIKSVGDCFFTLGTAAQVNNAGATYHFTVWWDD